MLHIGLTGNMGSGKSVVSRIFSVLGVPVYHADEAARAQYLKPEVLQSIISMFGPGMICADGTLNRAALASLVFTDKDALARLNSMIHPLVREDVTQWKRKFAGFPYTIHEAAIIYESGFSDEYDLIVHVSCPAPLAIERVMKRDGITLNQVNSRLQHQWPDEKKSAMADHVIINDGETLVIPQVLELDKLFRNPAR